MPADIMAAFDERPRERHAFRCRRSGSTLPASLRSVVRLVSAMKLASVMVVAGVMVVSIFFGPAAAAQAFPVGSFAVSDEDGTIWEVSALGAARTIASVTPPVWGLDFDHAGDLVVGGRGAIWRVDRGGAVSSVVVGFHVYNVGDVEVNPRGNIYATAMGNNFVTEWTPSGQVVDVIVLTGSTRAWGLAIDPSTGLLFIAGDGGIYKYAPATKTLTRIWVAGLTNFLQGGAWSPFGRFVFADETPKRLHEIDAAGNLTTVYSGPPFVDVGEGITVDAFGNFVFTDDGAITGVPQNRIFQLRPGASPTLSTLLAGGPFTDVNGIAAAPGLVLSNLNPTVRIGQTASIGVLSVDGALEPFVFATALSAQAGFALPGGRRFGLDVDPLLLATARNQLPSVFVGYQGFLSVSGNTTVTIRVPNLAALAGVELYTAGVTLAPPAPGGIHLVSTVAKTRIVQ